MIRPMPPIAAHARFVVLSALTYALALSALGYFAENIELRTALTMASPRDALSARSDHVMALEWLPVLVATISGIHLLTLFGGKHRWPPLGAPLTILAAVLSPICFLVMYTGVNALARTANLPASVTDELSVFFMVLTAIAATGLVHEGFRRRSIRAQAALS